MPSASAGPAGPTSSRQGQLPQPASINGHGIQSASSESPIWPFVPAQLAPPDISWPAYISSFFVQNDDANSCSHAGPGQPIGAGLVAHMFKALDRNRAIKKRKERELQALEQERVERFEDEQRRKRPRLDPGLDASEDAQCRTSVEHVTQHAVPPTANGSIRVAGEDSSRIVVPSSSPKTNEPAHAAQQPIHDFGGESAEPRNPSQGEPSSRAQSPRSVGDFTSNHQATSAALANLREQALGWEAAAGFQPIPGTFASGRQASGSASVAYEYDNAGYGQQSEESFRVPETQIAFGYPQPSEGLGKSPSAQHSSPAMRRRAPPSKKPKQGLTTPVKGKMAAATGRKSPHARKSVSRTNQLSSQSPLSAQKLKLGFEAASSRPSTSGRRVTEEVLSPSRSKGKVSSGADGRVNTSSLAPTALEKGRAGPALARASTLQNFFPGEGSRDASRPDESFESVTTLSDLSDEEGAEDGVPLAQICAPHDIQPIHLASNTRTSPSGKEKSVEINSKLTVHARQNKLRVETEARKERSSWNWSQLPDVTDPSIQPKPTANGETSRHFAQAGPLDEDDGPAIAARIRAAQAARQEEEGVVPRQRLAPQDLMFWDPAPRPKNFDPVKALEKARKDALINERAASKIYREPSKVRRTDVAKARVLPTRGLSLVTLAPIPMAQGSSRTCKSGESCGGELLDSAGRPVPAKSVFIGAEESQERRAARARAQAEAEIVSSSKGSGRGGSTLKRVKFSAEVKGGEEDGNAQGSEQQACSSHQADLGTRSERHLSPTEIERERMPEVPKPVLAGNPPRGPSEVPDGRSSHASKKGKSRNTELDTEVNTELRTKPQLLLGQEPASRNQPLQASETRSAAVTGEAEQSKAPVEPSTALAPEAPHHATEQQSKPAEQLNVSDNLAARDHGLERDRSSAFPATWDLPSTPKVSSIFKSVAEQVAWIEQRRFIPRNTNGSRRVDSKQRKALEEAASPASPAELSRSLAGLPNRPLFAGLRFYIVEAFDKSIFGWVNRITIHGGIIMTDKEALFADEKDKAPTHLITHLSGKDCCQELGLTSLERLLPNVIAVRFGWLTECIQTKSLILDEKSAPPSKFLIDSK